MGNIYYSCEKKELQTSALAPPRQSRETLSYAKNDRRVDFTDTKDIWLYRYKV